MDRVEETRLAWQRAQAELQGALVAMERAVADGASGDLLVKLRAVVSDRQMKADEMLQRHITQLAKP